MSDTSFDLAELGRLIALLSDGSITPAELDGLEKLLRDNAQARDYYHRYLALDVDLGWSHADTPTPAFDPEEARRVVSVERANRRRRFVAAGVGIGLAAAVLAAVVVNWPAHNQPPAPVAPELMARIVERSGEVEVVDLDGVVGPAGASHPLISGQTVRTGPGDSFGVVEFLDGTRLELASESVTQISLREGAGKNVFLSRGLLRADVVKQPAGLPMLVTTPHAVVEVLGTRFTSSTVANSTRIELEKGRVEVTRRSDGAKIDLLEGRFTVADRNQAEQLFTPRASPPRVKKSRQLPRIGPGPILSIALTPDESTLAVGNWDGSVVLWNLDADRGRHLFQAHKRKVRVIAYSADGKLLATGSDDKSVRVFDVKTCEELYRLGEFVLEVQDLAFSPDGRYLAVTPANLRRPRERESLVRLYDAKSGVAVHSLGTPERRALSLAFSPDSQLLATGDADGQVYLWNVADGTEAAHLAGHGARITALAFSPDGKLLATGSQEGMIQLWNTDTWQVARELGRHHQGLRSLVFTPDGKSLASAAHGPIRLWNVASGAERLTFSGHSYLTTDILFTRDGQTMITSGWDRGVRIWSMTPPPVKKKE